MDFRVGEKVVYPNQGVGIIEQISTRNLTGQSEVFYLLRLNTSTLRVMVPRSNVGNVGLRRVTRGPEIEPVVDYLQKGSCKTGGDWKGRFKANCEKMRSGSLKEVAEVFKSLVTLSQAKPLSFREKKMFDRAWNLLVDEITISRGQSRETTEAQLLRVLGKANLRVQLPS